MTTHHPPQEPLAAAAKRSAVAFARFARTRDPGSFVTAFDATAGDLLLVALRLGREHADDLLQQTWQHAIRRARHFDPRRPLLPWLVGILVREAQQLRRERGREARRLGGLAAMQDPRLPADPHDAASLSEFADHAAAALEALDVTHRQVLVLRIKHGLSSVEIGEALGRSPETVRSQLARGLEKLRRLLPAGHALPALLVADLAVGGQAASVSVNLAALRDELLAEWTAATAGTSGGVGAGAGAMVMKKSAWIVAVALLALTWWVLLPSPVETPSAAAIQNDLRPAPRPIARTGSPTRAPSRTAVAEDSASVEPHIDVLVVDPEGAPIPGAAVFWHAAGARIYDVPGDVLRSDTAGSVRLARPDEVAGLEVVAGARGWQTGASAPEPDATRMDIVLEPAVEQSFHVTDVFGEPVPGAVVRLWKRCPPAEQEARAGERLAGTGEAALFEAVTDGEGRATVAGLPAGEVVVRVAATGYVPDVMPERRLAVPGDCVEVVLEPLVGMFVASSRGAITRLAAEHIDQELFGSVNPPGQWEQVLQNVAYVNRHPDASIFLWGGNRAIWDRLRDAPIPIPLAVFVEGLGWGRGHGHIRLLGGVRAPELVEPTSFGGAGQVRIVLVDPEGRRTESGRIVVQTSSPLSEVKAGFDIALGQTVWLPLGPLQLAAEQLPVRSVDDRNGFEILPGIQDIEIPIAASVRPFSLRLRLPDGSIPMSALVQMEQRSICTGAGVIEQLVSCEPFEITYFLSDSERKTNRIEAGFDGIDLEHVFAWED